jgi:sarcosine oxidase subunit beta
MSPDRQPILGAAPERDGFFLACGFSGHGFMFAPMTGVLVSEIIFGEPTTLDMSELNIDRFKNKKTIDIEKSVV